MEPKKNTFDAIVESLNGTLYLKKVNCNIQLRQLFVVKQIAMLATVTLNMN